MLNIHRRGIIAVQLQAGSACNDRITLLAADIKRYDAVLLRNNEHAKGYLNKASTGLNVQTTASKHGYDDKQGIKHAKDGY